MNEWMSSVLLPFYTCMSHQLYILHVVTPLSLLMYRMQVEFFLNFSTLCDDQNLSVLIICLLKLLVRWLIIVRTSTFLTKFWYFERRYWTENQLWHSMSRLSWQKHINDVIHLLWSSHTHTHTRFPRPDNWLYCHLALYNKLYWQLFCLGVNCMLKSR